MKQRIEPRAKRTWARVWVCAAALSGVACSTPSAPPPPPPTRTPPVASASAAPLPPALKGPEYTENDFVESDHNRDPFRSFLVQNQPVNRQAMNQRKVELAQFSLDELKLVAIVTGSDTPSAMFVDPSGKGTVVYRGTFICRPEVVHIGGSNGPEYQLNWRIDRIRSADVVLIREDPAQPAIPPATRVVPLHPEADKENEGFAHG
ncbi:MAG: pilus assembly protein PilP [Myxococcales bacterium]|nr:pilus assembly protein PilP [Myxococcales bacterium]